jgi:SIR2-like domain
MISPDDDKRSDATRPQVTGPSQLVEPPYPYILDKLRKGRVIPFIGAGASFVGRPPKSHWVGPASNFLPLASELAQYLDTRSGFPSDQTAELTRVAQFFDGVTGRGGLDEELHDVFSKEYTPSALHYALAGFDNLVVVTTNYDNLLERAFRERGRPFHLIVYRTSDLKLLFWEHGATAPVETAASELTFDLSSASVIYKMHGTADQRSPERDSYVITEDDYVEFLARMVDMTAIPAGLAEPFRRSHFLFLGYGLRDWNLRVILQRIWGAQKRSYNSWAIQLNPQTIDRKSWAKRNVDLLDMRLEDYVPLLEQAVMGNAAPTPAP